VDIKDFFDNVTAAHLSGLISDEVIQKCFLDGSPRQGLPTSPVIADIAFAGVDKEIVSHLRDIEYSATYTRYADDLYVSFDDQDNLERIESVINAAVRNNGFRLNSRKRRLQFSSDGRRIITGIGVDESSIYASRKTKKKLRAAIHQRNLASARGLHEWALCKLPKSMEKTYG